MKICFKYLPIQLERKGKYYPNHQIDVPLLEWKTVVYDESNYPLKSPNTIYEYGFIDILDPTVEADVLDLIDTLWVAVWLKKITTLDFQTALEANGYTWVNGVYEITPEITDIDGTVIPAVILDTNI